MMTFLARYQHFRMKHWLLPYMDDALPSRRQQQIQAHLQQCPLCRKSLPELQALRGQLHQLNAAGPINDSAVHWTTIRQALTEKKRPRKMPAYQLAIPLALVGLLLAFGVYRKLDQKTGTTPVGNMQSTGLIDLSGFIEHFYDPSQRSAFFERYEVSMQESQFACCNMLAGKLRQNIAGHCEIIETRLLQLPGGKCTVLDCLVDGKPLVIFQEHSGGEWGLGNAIPEPAAQLPLSCCLLQDDSLKIATWRHAGISMVAIGSFNDDELRTLLDASK